MSRPSSVALPAPCLAASLLAIIGATALIYAWLFPWHTDDADIWFVPWLNAIIAHGPVASLAQPMLVTADGTNGFANYNPPYLYLLILGSAAHAALGALTIVKLVSVAGTLFCAACAYRLLRCFLEPRRSLLAASVIPLLPTVALNTAAWGQCDTIYAGFALLVVASALRAEWALMMAALGAGLAFKLQTALIGPFVLYMVLSRRPPPWTLLLPPLTYAAFLLPAWCAGRPAWDLANVYVEQAHAYRWLSMNAPNPWLYIQHLHLLTYQDAVGPAMALAACAGLAIGGLALVTRLEGRAALLLAATSAAAMPYLLPKMHDRYFMVAELLSFCLAVIATRSWTVLAATLLQLGSLGAYLSILCGLHIGTYLGVIPIGLALAILLHKLSTTARAASVANR